MIIKQHLNPKVSFPVSDAIRMLDVSKSGYYEWLRKSKKDSDAVRFEMKLRDEMHNIAIEFPSYGYSRMTMELHNRGYHVNHKRVLRLMQQDNLLCVKKRFKPLTTDSNHNHKVYPNLIRDFKITRPDQVWASDITYIQLVDEFVYLAVLLDLFLKMLHRHVARYHHRYLQ